MATLARAVQILRACNTTRQQIIDHHAAEQPT
jgi:hypothetical protein